MTIETARFSNAHTDPENKEQLWRKNRYKSVLDKAARVAIVAFCIFASLTAIAGGIYMMPLITAGFAVKTVFLLSSLIVSLFWGSIAKSFIIDLKNDYSLYKEKDARKYLHELRARPNPISSWGIKTLFQVGLLTQREKEFLTGDEYKRARREFKKKQIVYQYTKKSASHKKQMGVKLVEAAKIIRRMHLENISPL